jgi:hypothetical protein
VDAARAQSPAIVHGSLPYDAVARYMRRQD